MQTRQKTNLVIILGLTIMVVSFCLPTVLQWYPDWSHYTHFNKDSRLAFFSWAQNDGSYPWEDPVLADPGSSIVRISLLLPNMTAYLVRQWVGPKLAWLVLGAVAWGLTLLIVMWLFRLEGFSRITALVGAAVFIAFQIILADLPPLSPAQLNYLLDHVFLRFDDSMPRFYKTSTEFFYVPHFLFSIALSIYFLSNTFPPRKKFWIAALWTVTVGSYPFIYLWSWVEFCAVMPVMIGAILWINRVSWRHLWDSLKYPGAIIGVAWLVYFVVQNALVDSEAGRDYMLTVGLQEARFLFVDKGAVLRIGLFGLVLLILSIKVLKLRSVLLLVTYGVYAASQPLANMQVIVGRTIQPIHFGFRNQEVLTLFWILLGLYSWRWLTIRYPQLNQRWRPVVLVGLFILAAGYNFAWNLHAWDYVQANATLSDDQIEVLQFFDDQPEYKVFLADDIDLESNLIFLESRRTYLPWAQASTVHPVERTQRLYDAWWLLFPTDEVTFGEWLSSPKWWWHFYNAKYGTGDGYSSTLWFDDETKAQVLSFREDRQFPEPERPYYAQIDTAQTVHYKLDVIVHNVDLPLASCVAAQPVLLANESYVIYAAPRACD